LNFVLNKAPTFGGGPEKVLPFPARKGRALSQGSIARGIKAILSFRGSRAGLFYDLSARETCPLRCSPAPVEREPGLPPQISHEKTAPSHQSLQKSLCLSSPHRGGLLRSHALREDPYFTHPALARECWSNGIMGFGIRVIFYDG
jgi:hypothetical protein